MQKTACDLGVFWFLESGSNVICSTLHWFCFVFNLSDFIFEHLVWVYCWRVAEIKDCSTVTVVPMTMKNLARRCDVSLTVQAPWENAWLLFADLCSFCSVGAYEQKKTGAWNNSVYLFTSGATLTHSQRTPECNGQMPSVTARGLMDLSLCPGKFKLYSTLY